MVDIASCNAAILLVMPTVAHTIYAYLRVALMLFSLA